MGELYLTVCPNWCFTTNLNCHKNSRIVLAWDPDVFNMDIIHMDSQIIYGFVTRRSSDECFFFVHSSMSSTLLQKGRPYGQL